MTWQHFIMPASHRRWPPGRKGKARQQVTYRRERSIRDAYDERFLPERAPSQYPRPAGPGPGPGPAERRGPYSRPEDGYGRGDYEYGNDGRFFPNGGGQRTFHGEDQRAYHGDNVHFPAERRTAPPARREEYPYRVPREEPHTGRPIDFGARAPPPPSVRNQALYPAVRSLAEGDADTLMQAILNLDRGEDRDPYRRKSAPAPAPAPAPFPPIRERSPARREVARSPHSRSGSSVSSRGYSPDRTKGLPFPSQQGKITMKETATAARRRRRGAVVVPQKACAFPACGNTMSGMDRHAICAYCLGERHAREALGAPGGCSSCDDMDYSTKKSRFKRVKVFYSQGTSHLTTADRGVPWPTAMPRRCASSLAPRASLDHEREAFPDRESQPVVRPRQHTSSSSQASAMRAPSTARNGKASEASWSLARPRQLAREATRSSARPRQLALEATRSSVRPRQPAREATRSSVRPRQPDSTYGSKPSLRRAPRTTVRPRQPTSVSSDLAAHLDPSPDRMFLSREVSLTGSWSHHPHRQWGDMMDEEFPLDDDDELPSYQEFPRENF